MRRGVVQAGAAYLVFSWLLIQVADIVTPTLNLPAWVPTVVTVGAIGGFPIVLVLAWMLEQKDGRWFLDRGRQSGKMLSGLERNYLSILVAYGVAATGALAYQLTVGFDVPGGPEVTVAEADELLPVNPNSIAVLKFLNIGDNETGEFFSQGLGEDILDRLARIPGLAVSSRGDSWSLPENASSDVVRDRLRVEYYVEGSVRLVGDDLRVVAQLIRSNTGFHVFSRSFDIRLSSFMDVQREITDLIIANLRVSLPGDSYADVSTAGIDPNIDAYVLYRRGKKILDQPLAIGSIEEAIGFFEQSLMIDPDFSAAHAGICRAHVARFEMTDSPESIELAESACGAALAANPNLNVVHTAFGRLHWNTGNLEDAEKAYREALAINAKDVAALQGIAKVEARRNNVGEAVQMLKRAIDLQPGNWRSIYSLGGLYFANGMYSEAAYAYRQVVLLDPDNWLGHGNLGGALMMMGEFEAALDSIKTSLDIGETASDLSNLGIIYYYLGEFDNSASIHREAANKMPEVSFVWLNLGDALRFSSTPELASEAYRRAAELSADLLEINPNSPSDLFDRSWALAALGEIDEASFLISRAIELAPNDPYGHYYGALIDVLSGNNDDALDALELAVEKGYPPAMLVVDPLLSDLHEYSKFRDFVSEHNDIK
jgi:tetratricopeptide (TPR) repeat protein